MKTAIRHVRSWAGDWASSWNDFWFTPADPLTLAVIRILGGLMLFYTHLVWGYDFDAFFGQSPWITEGAAATLERPWAWSHHYWIDSPSLLWLIHIIALIAFLMLTFGLMTRVAAVLAFLFTVSYANRLPGALFGLDDVNAMLALYLMVGPSGKALSLDRLLSRRRGRAMETVDYSPWANVAIRLIQIHLCIIYLFSGIGKLAGPYWWEGTAIWGAVANLEYQTLDLTWLADWPLLVNFLTHLTVFWEVYYCALVWPRLTRPLVLLLAVPLHLGIAFGLGMITFGLVMLIANLAFLPPEFFRYLLRMPAAEQGRAGEVQRGKQPGDQHARTKSSR